MSPAAIESLSTELRQQLAALSAEEILSSRVLLAEKLGSALQARAWRVTTAESCTGGMVASAITDIAGASAWFDQGIVSYANASKTQWLGVSAELIDSHGAVSDLVAAAMALGALERGQAQLAIATTGIAGPSGGSPLKPVGLVWFGLALSDGVSSSTVFTTSIRANGDRAAIRQQATWFALAWATAILESSPGRADRSN